MKWYRRWCSGILAGTEGDSPVSRAGGPTFNGNKWVWIQREFLRVGQFYARAGWGDWVREVLMCNTESRSFRDIVWYCHKVTWQLRYEERKVMSGDWGGRMWLFRSKILHEIGERSNGEKFNQVLRSPARTWRKWKTKMTSTDQTLFNNSKWSCLCRSTTKRS